MKIGIPRGLLYPKYHIFAKAFFKALGAELIISPATNKKILDEGVKLCADEACLPMKVFHGHVAWLRDRCDALFIPRFMSIEKNEHICPMFCGLIEMLKSNINGLPRVIDEPIYSFHRDKLFKWARRAAAGITSDRQRIKAAFDRAWDMQGRASLGYRDEYDLKIALIGHAYNVFDEFVNMDIRKKLNKMGIGIVTGECVGKSDIEAQAAKLFKKPFWTFAKEYYGAALSIFKNSMADGMIYLSSFSCGIDSVVTELIKIELGDFPFMVLKLDEHTGEAGYNTRLEAFADMLKRRRAGFDNNLSQYGQCGICRTRSLPGA
jgi:predicted nucleotide-binding protein (sugar kinase/HSP70/actin superfamily)